MQSLLLPQAPQPLPSVLHGSAGPHAEHDGPQWVAVLQSEQPPPVQYILAPHAGPPLQVQPPAPQPLAASGWPALQSLPQLPQLATSVARFLQVSVCAQQVLPAPHWVAPSAVLGSQSSSTPLHCSGAVGCTLISTSSQSPQPSRPGASLAGSQPAHARYLSASWSRSSLVG